MKSVFVARFADVVVCSFSLVMPVAYAVKEMVLHSFAGGSVDGAEPEAGQIYMNGSLYGTTASGGTGCDQNLGCGTVFSLDPKTVAEHVVCSFCA